MEFGCDSNTQPDVFQYEPPNVQDNWNYEPDNVQDNWNYEPDNTQDNWNYEPDKTQDRCGPVIARLMFRSIASALSTSTASRPPPPRSNPSLCPPTFGMPHLQQHPLVAGMPYCQYYPLPNPAMGYLPPYIPPPVGQPYYPPPGVVYPGLTGPNYQAPQPQHQQQQQVAFMNNNPTVATSSAFIGAAPSVPMIGAIVLSCVTFWLFGFLFGGIAFIMAMVGQSSAAAGDNDGATRMRNASYGLSIAGIVIAVIIFAVIAGFTAKNSYNTVSSGDS